MEWRQVITRDGIWQRREQASPPTTFSPKQNLRFRSALFRGRRDTRLRTGPAATPALSTESAEGFDEIARFGRMTEMCGVIGYTVDPLGFDALLAASIALAEKEGVPHDKAVAMFETAAAARKAKDAPVTEAFSRRMVAAYTANDRKAGGVVLNEWFMHEDETCRGFTQSARLVAFIDPPADPENKAGFNAFIDMVLSRLK